MDNTKNDDYYVKKIAEHLRFIQKHMRDIDQQELAQNEILLDSMLFRLVQISENGKKVSDQYKMLHANVPWMAIYGLRNRIVHDYGNVDLGIVYATLKEDAPKLLELIKEES